MLFSLNGEILSYCGLNLPLGGVDFLTSDGFFGISDIFPEGFYIVEEGFQENKWWSERIFIANGWFVVVTVGGMKRNGLRGCEPIPCY